jgi:hypothetical protein
MPGTNLANAVQKSVCEEERYSHGREGERFGPRLSVMDFLSLSSRRVAQVYRSYIELGQHDVVQSEIGDDAPTALQAVKLLATYRSQKEMRDTVKANLTSWLSDSETGNNPTLQLVAGIIYMEEGDFEEAAKVRPSAPPPPL